MKPGPASDPSPPRSLAVLEANLRALLGHCWRAVLVRPEFRARLRAQFVARALEPAARALAPGPARVDRPGTPRRVFFPRAAAAALLCAAAFGAVFAWRRARDPLAPLLSGEQIAASGAVALRAGDAGWRALSDDEVRRGIEIDVADELPLALLTPAALPEGSAALELRVEGGRLRVGPAAELGVTAAEAQPRELDLALERGYLELAQAGSAPGWRVRTPAGWIVVHAAELALAHRAPWAGGEPHAPPPAALGVPGATDALVARVLVGRGEALLLDASGAPRVPAAPLPVGTTCYLVDGELRASETAPPDARAELPAAATPPELSATATAHETAPETEPPADAGATLVGRVRVAERDEPVTRFELVLLASVRLPEVAQPQAHALEQPAGEFALSGLEPGLYTVFVRADGLATLRVHDVVLEAGATVTLDLRLERGATVHGRVVDARGQPVEGAWVLSEEDAPTQVLPLAEAFVPPGSLRGARSGPDGRFELALLSPGRHHLRASRAGLGAAWSDALQLVSGAVAEDVELALGVPAGLSGRVSFDDGKPWPGATVVASYIDYSFERPRMSVGVAQTDAEGNYAIEDLPAGTYAVLTPDEIERYRRPPRVRSVLLQEGERLAVDLPGDRAGVRLAGRLSDAHGAPLADHDLTLQQDDAEGAFATSRSDAEGRFAFEGVLPGRYLVYCGPSLGVDTRSLGIDMVLVDEVVVPAGPSFELELVTGSAALAGRVVDGTDRRALADVVLILERTDVAGDPTFAGKSSSDAQGRWRFAGLPAGEYRVLAYPTRDPLALEPLEGLTLVDGQERADVELALFPGADLLVSVRDADGQPLAGVTLRFEDDLGRRVACTIDDRTDEQGRLHAHGLRPGTWRVEARSGERRAEARVSLTAFDDETLELVLR